MSAFVTEIPVDIESVRKLLPQDSDFEGIAWNAAKKCVEMKWSNRRLQTPFSFYLPFSIELLQSGGIPAGVTPKVTPPPAVEVVLVDENVEKTTTFSVKGLTPHKGRGKQPKT